MKLEFDERVFIQKSELFQTQCNAGLLFVCRVVQKFPSTDINPYPANVENMVSY